VVKSIENTSGGAGFVVGFAQFPGGAAATDGVVLKYDFTSSIGTAANSGNVGRTATHEVGHWLNLRHIWGDANCGSDFVTDTPTQQGPNQSNCPNFPSITCNNGPNGDMFTNYMDYTNGNCQNIFSVGQCTRMNAALSSATSGRNNLWTPANLIATGTTGTPGAVCVPVAAFINKVHYVCEGTTITFTDGSWNGTPDTWSWDFPGGTPATSADQNPVIQYNTAGTYDITLTVTNSAGSNSYTETASVVVVPASGQYSVPYSEGFESISFPGTEWAVENGGGNTWTQTGLATHSGLSAVYINNFTGNTTQTTDVFVTPTYNLSNVTQANLTFWLAFAARSASSTDQLKVFASTTCGQLWSIRYNKTGTTLSTAGLITSNFIPTAAQWRQETVNISSSSYNNKPNVRFKFEYFQGNGNNIFIDDLNLDGTVGLNEVLEASLALSVYPNPVMNQATVEFTLTEKNAIRIDVVDVLGRVVNTITETTLDAGDYQFELPAGLASGLYSVLLNVNGYTTSRKVVIQ
jgi:PKD repeat protein